MQMPACEIKSDSGHSGFLLPTFAGEPAMLEWPCFLPALGYRQYDNNSSELGWLPFENKQPLLIDTKLNYLEVGLDMKRLMRLTQNHANLPRCVVTSWNRQLHIVNR